MEKYNKSNNPTPTIESPWFTIEEAAEYLKLYNKTGTLNISYLYKLVSSGLLVPHKLGKFNRFRREQLDALLTQESV